MQKRSSSCKGVRPLYSTVPIFILLFIRLLNSFYPAPSISDTKTEKYTESTSKHTLAIDNPLERSTTAITKSQATSVSLTSAANPETPS